MTTEGHWEHAGAPPRPDASGGDFVATLGARVTDLRRTVDSMSRDSSSALRIRFLRRLHALGAAARSLGFTGVAQKLADMKALLEGGEATPEDLTAIGRALGEIADVANGGPEAAWFPDPASGTPPATVCVVGDESLEALLRQGSTALCKPSDSNDSPMAFASSRLCDPASARGHLGPYAPDLFLVDLDLPGAVELIRDLVDDPRTDLVPIVAVTAEVSGVSECAALGVARTFSKPVDVAELRRTCIDAVEQRRGRTVRMTLPPEPEEARAAVVELLSPPERPSAAGAVPPKVATARQERPQEPEEVALAISAEEIEREVALAIDERPRQEPLQDIVCEIDVAAAEPAVAPSAAPQALADVSVDRGGLVGRRVVVASGEPAVGWFVAGELSKWGCTVDEAPASSGARDLVLEVGQRSVVDLVIADVGSDGGADAALSLLRAIRWDSVARDAAVVLLCREEDALRESHGDALGAVCVRLGSPISTVVAAGVEAMARHARLEQDVRAGAEASGSLAVVTPRRLIAVAEEAETSCKIRLFDGVYLHEIFVLRGDVRRATRAAPSGRVEVGDRALATALGVDYGSFTIEPLDAEAVARETEVTPEPSELLAQTIRMRCAMKRCLEGLDVARVARLTFDEDMVHWVRTLEGAPRAVLDQLLAGFSPRLLAHMAGFAPGDIARSIECALERGFVVAVRDELADLTVGKPVALLPPAKEDHTAPSPPVRFDEDSAPPKPEPESEVHLVGATLSLEDEPRGERAHSRRTDVSAAQPWFREEPRQLTPPPVPLATGAPASPQRLELPAPAPVGRTRGRPAPSGPSDGAANPRVPGDELAPPEPSPPLPEIPLPGVPRSDPFLATSVTAAPPPPARRARLRTAALLLVAASVVGGAARFAVSPGSPHPPAAAAAPPPSAVRSSSPSAPSLPPQGLLEVTAPEAMAIVVDGTERGHGPKLSVTLGEGMHELLTDTNGGAAAGAKKRFIEIARGRVTHVDLTLAAPPASPPK